MFHFRRADDGAVLSSNFHFPMGGSNIPQYSIFQSAIDSGKMVSVRVRENVRFTTILFLTHPFLLIVVYNNTISLYQFPVDRVFTEYSIVDI